MSLFLSAADVRRLLPMAEAIEAMADAFRALSDGKALLPLRTIVWTPDRRGGLGLMPGYLPGRFGAKVVTVFPGNHATELDSHQGVVLLFEGERGRLLAIADATEITAIRTAAVSALATRLLAREDAGDLAIFGSGTQARTHLAAMLAVRRIRRVRVWSLSVEAARAFADREGKRHGIAIETPDSAEAAARDAEILCTTTSSRDPFLRADWLSPGAHVNAVGSSVATARELEGAAVARCALFVDRRESTVNESGDFLFAKAEGAIGDDHIRGEIGDVLTGRTPGRRSAGEITLFKSLGLAIEDVAAAEHVWRRATEVGAGVEIDASGRREA
ncbi:MAG TPA: ornithine cyclodeaminase family protein [Thermoanaerobaculia bacterium]|jgi:ornithine cyclodeaminase|nr:ornithine cyclodeaminase family protein [Thermoanaerobaculia bacterium]